MPDREPGRLRRVKGTGKLSGIGGTERGGFRRKPIPSSGIPSERRRPGKRLFSGAQKALSKAGDRKYGKPGGRPSAAECSGEASPHETGQMKKNPQSLRWGYSTGACAAAVARAAWTNLLHGETPESVWLAFPDGRKRELPLLPDSPYMAAIRKDGGDDPDCTHGATVYASIGPCREDDGRPEDYTLHLGDGVVFLRAVEGIGLCTREGLDCDPGRWAINSGPRRMIAENLRLAGLASGCWLLEIGIEGGEALARHTLNAHLGITGGLSLLGTSGLVRPYSHEAYVHTIRICVRSHRLSGGSSVVFCTGGRTRAGARDRLGGLPETAFVNMGDFIAESLSLACRAGMREILVACMPGKLCKYASGLGNTHAHRAGQDMTPLLEEATRALPEERELHRAIGRSASIREALLSMSEGTKALLLRRLAGTALERLSRRCFGNPQLRLLLFDFEGRFLFEERREASESRSCSGQDAAKESCSAGAEETGTEETGTDGERFAEEAPPEETSPVMADTAEMVGPFYFMEGRRPC